MNINLKYQINVLFLLILFCVKNCLTDYIHESELEDLRESMKHHLIYKKNITKIPHDCTDRPFVEIDLVFKEDNINGSKYYAVYGNKNFYIEIEGITRDHLPIIHRDIQPMAVDSRFMRKMVGKNPIKEYRFVGPLYLYKAPNEKDMYSLVGFNQVWVGCPQPLCISPGFDGILSMDGLRGQSMRRNRRRNNIIVVFRGNYFWFYDFSTDKPPTHPPLTDMAVRVEDRWVDRRAVGQYDRPYRNRIYPNDSPNYYLNDSMVVPTYIDAIVPGINKYNNCLYFFKNDQFVCYERLSRLSTPLKIANEWKSHDNSWKSAKIDASFHIKSLIYFIAGDQLWCFSSDRISCLSYPKKLKELHKDFPTNITSAFQRQEYIYIIKGSVYYKVLVSRFPMKMNSEDMIERYLFQDLLGCDEALYTAWGFESYDNFIEKIAQRMQIGINSSNHINSAHFNPTFLIISFLVLLIGSSVLLAVWYLRPNWITKVMRILKTPFN